MHPVAYRPPEEEGIYESADHERGSAGCQDTPDSERYARLRLVDGAWPGTSSGGVPRGIWVFSRGLFTVAYLPNALRYGLAGWLA